MSDKWISVDDKLPGHNERVLCWQRIHGYALTCYTGRTWLDVADGSDFPLADVTHWRELPPSPTEEAGNE